ncbi:GAF and ANTAR domain-containing protein [Pseudonocardia bannensis]|uniref:GAF and ANTAR domain-containing protein n=1 Tax=Pseudonocardia bannensis TaxID=630973 RepID=A0A848DN34_9PSEU|nr:GAF and ANTAR domain-containing protein [Pseudonocardia bannensis]NMH93896.1 GAF and ANTAR domain-containing protein [Pseudonocardia bannensis]
MFSPDSALIGLALQVGRTPAANLDVGAMLAGVCTALPVALGVAGAVIVVVEPPDPMSNGVFASDAVAGRLGEMQHGSGQGPLPSAIRSGRVMVTADLARMGPSELAAAAVDTGLVSSVAVPLLIDGRPAGGMQLLGTGYQPVSGSHAEMVRPLIDMLAARLLDSRAFRQLSGAAARSTAQLEASTPIEQATGMLAERYRTDVEEAARFLHSQARNARVAVAEMAASVVAGTDRPAALPEPRRDGRPPARPDERAPGRGDEPPSAPSRARHRRLDTV